MNNRLFSLYSVTGTKCRLYRSLTLLFLSFFLLMPKTYAEEIVTPISEGFYNGHRYALYDSASTWEMARGFCEELGGHLATISSAEENAFLYRFVTNAGYSNAYFGFSDSIVENKWVWVTGEPVEYTNWADGEPNGENPHEDYAMFYWKFTDGTWNDGDFGNNTVNDDTCFLCEWDKDSVAGFADNSLVLPASLSVINEQAFFGDVNLDDVKLPETVVRIEKKAFADSSIITINLPSGITYIADDAFSNCDSMTAIVEKDSYAHQYCADHDIKYVFSDDPDAIIRPPAYRALVIGEQRHLGYDDEGKYIIDDCTRNAADADNIEEMLLRVYGSDGSGQYGYQYTFYLYGTDPETLQQRENEFMRMALSFSIIQ